MFYSNSNSFIWQTISGVENLKIFKHITTWLNNIWFAFFCNKNGFDHFIESRLVVCVYLHLDVNNGSTVNGLAHFSVWLHPNESLVMTGCGISYWDHISNICVRDLSVFKMCPNLMHLCKATLISITIIWFFFLLILYIYKHHCFNSFAIEWPTYQKYLMYFFFLLLV